MQGPLTWHWAGVPRAASSSRPPLRVAFSGFEFLDLFQMNIFSVQLCNPGVEETVTECEMEMRESRGWEKLDGPMRVLIDR